MVSIQILSVYDEEVCDRYVRYGSVQIYEDLNRSGLHEVSDSPCQQSNETSMIQINPNDESTRGTVILWTVSGSWSMTC